MIKKEVLAGIDKKSLDRYKDFVVEIQQREQLSDGSWKTTKKQYVTVAGRLLMFWNDNLAQGKEGYIHTEKVEDDEEKVEFVAEVDGARGSATGTAREPITENADAKSLLEKCETSAVGRALGNLGYGLLGSVAPAEDVDRVVKREGSTENKFFIKNPDAPITEAQVKRIEKNRNPSTEPVITRLLEYWKKENVGQLTRRQAHELITEMDRRLGK